MTDTLVRMSPSGPLVAAGGGAVSSVFARIGAVVAQSGDYSASLIDNDSSVPGGNCANALDNLTGTDDRSNSSAVPGATVSDALDYLLAHGGGATAGRIVDTFCGGPSAPSASLDARIGDKRWNAANTLVVAGSSITRIAPEAGVCGAIRVTGPTSVSGAPSGITLYLGRETENNGPFVWQDVSEARFRARMSTTNAPAVSCGISLADNSAPGSLVELTIFANIATTPNFIASTFIQGSGTFTLVTSVPVDSNFHDFVIRRVSASQIDFLIDGVVVASSTDPLASPIALERLCPRVTVICNASPVVVQTFVDIDTFELVPV